MHIVERQLNTYRVAVNFSVNGVTFTRILRVVSSSERQAYFNAAAHWRTQFPNSTDYVPLRIDIEQRNRVSICVVKPSGLI